MANELEKFDNEIEAVAEEQVELDEFKASGENSEMALGQNLTVRTPLR